jgi:hypothetical protein
VAVKVKGRLVVSKQATLISGMERFSLKKLNKAEGEEQYKVKV